MSAEVAEAPTTSDCSLIECEYCGSLIDADDAPSMTIPSAELYLCECGRWSEDTR